MPAATIRVGTANGKGFTPQGENLPKSSLVGLIPCTLYGVGIDRPTALFIRPGRVRYQVEKYQKLNQTLKYPADYDLNSEQLSESDRRAAVRVSPVAVPRPPRGSKDVPIICLNTGRFFDSGTKAAKVYGLIPQLVNAHLRGTIRAAKGRRMRFATPDEIKAADLDINWKYNGELLPLVTGKRKF